MCFYQGTSQVNIVKKIIIIMKSVNSIVMMKINPYETFRIIATKYCIQDSLAPRDLIHEAPSSGIQLYYNNREIQGEDTANSLGIQNGDTLIVKY